MMLEFWIAFAVIVALIYGGATDQLHVGYGKECKHKRPKTSCGYFYCDKCGEYLD